MSQAFRVTALVRNALRPDDVAAGARIFRVKASKILEGKLLEELIDEFHNGYTSHEFLKSVACLQAVLPYFTRKGMAVKLPGIGTLFPVIKGKVLPDQKSWKKSIRFRYVLRLEKSFEREIVQGMKCDFVQMMPAMPNPTLLEAGCWQDKGRTDFYPYQLVVLHGTRLKYNEDNPDEGIFFSARGCPTVRALPGIQQDKRMTFQIPHTLTLNRNYSVRVRAKLYRCKNVREGYLEQKIMIRAE